MTMKCGAEDSPDKVYWNTVWTNARHNMPKKRTNETGWSMLGYILYRKRGMHMTVYRYSYEGRPLKSAHKNLLLLLSGPYGQSFARMILNERGKDPNKYIWK